DAQNRALGEIRGDLASGERMSRLLQGDVGSGKTVVAMLAMADVVASGGQAVLMAPTEILARQHFETLAEPLEAHRIAAILLT
ncbi:DEAD/DEAH box helicase, partial [Priestia megaterium]|uniref:DEAD/DEAH box helicase n=1 Tax=Priestia megaterium TaxID=1404 RepID=UPI0035B5D43D